MCLSLCTDVAVLVPIAYKMTGRSRFSLDVVSKFGGASSKISSRRKRFLSLAAVRHQKKARRTQARHRMTDCIHRVPPRITEPGSFAWKDNHWLPRRESQNASSSSGRNESQNPSAQASGDRSQSTLKEDHDIELGDRCERNLKRTFGKLDFTNSPKNIATWCTFALDCMGTISNERTVETHTRGCHNSSVTNTQDTLNVLIGSLRKMSKVKNQSFCVAEDNCPVTGLTNDEWNSHVFFEEPIGTVLQANVRVFSESIFCTWPGASDSISASQTWKKQKR